LIVAAGFTAPLTPGRGFGPVARELATTLGTDPEDDVRVNERALDEFSVLPLDSPFSSSSVVEF